ESLSRCPPGARLRRSQDCDRVLRLCVERLAQPGTPPPGAAAVVAVAEAACRGYLSAVPRPAPLYLEKILYHLLRNAAQRGSADGSRRAAELLRARLRTHPPGTTPDKDFAAITSGSFVVLWRAAAALAEPEGPQEEGRAALRLRLWALRFLLLLERDGAAPPPLQPPFFASQTAQQAAAAAALYEAQRAPCPAFLGQQLAELLAVLREEAPEPPALQQSLCFFELTLERCRHLCKAGWHREAEDAVKDTKGFLGSESFSGPLSVLEAGIPADSVKQQLMVKQLLFRSIQLFTSLAYDTFLCAQVLPMGDWPGLEQLTSGCVRSVRWMLEGLGGLPDSERAKYLDITASCTYKLAYIFYHQQLPAAAGAVCEPLCASPCAADAFARPGVPPDRLKADAAKQGNEELRLRTLKEALEGQNLDADALVTVLFGELNAYKSVRADTGQERYNVLCDLLQICSEHSGRLHQRAVALTELAQLLCHRSYAPHTDCSSLDSVREALRLLELVPRSAQNRDQLLDDQAQALLWLFICSLESNLEKSIERDQRAKAQVLKNLEDFEPNDLKYDRRVLDERFLYDELSFDLATDAALSQSLDDAFALWKQLLGMPGVPAVRSPEQTVASLRLLAALYTLMAKPLQAMESYLLLRALCTALGDNLGAASALCHVTKLLFQLECPSYAQLFLEESESYLQKADGSHDSYPLLRQHCLLLRSQLCCITQRVEEGLSLLLEVLQDLAAQKVTKFWYLLRAHVLQLVAVYLSLPPARLSPRLRQRIFAHGWQTPGTALVEAQKLFRSLIYLLMGSKVLGAPTPAPDGQPVDCGDNVLLKWQVLGDALACSERLVALLGRLDVVCQAKAFCLDAAKLAAKLQAARCKKQPSQTKILPRRRKPERTEPPAAVSELPRDDDAFLKGPALEFVPVRSGLAAADTLTASPELKPARKRSPAFLSHPPHCSCSLCSDPVLSALCLRWLLSHARVELAAGAGAAAAGLALLRAVPCRCAAAANRFAAVLRQKLQGDGGDGRPPAPRLLDDVAAAAYAALALQSLASLRWAQELRKELETGLRFVASRSPHLPGLGGAGAVLLLAKAMAAVWRLAAERGGSTDAVFAGVWACQLPTPTLAEPDAAPLHRTQKPDKAQPRRRQNKAAVAPAAAKPRARRTPRAKALAMLNTDDAFALGDSDGEVPPIVIRPVSVACTPRQKAGPPPQNPRGPQNSLHHLQRIPPGGWQVPAPASPQSFGESQVPPKDVTSVIELLTKALNCISHCPPGALYGHVCRLLALATGSRDPLRAAYLLAESVAVTARHQLLSITHRKMRKEKKPAEDVAEQLRGLSLREGPPLAELERLFAFSPAALGPEVQDGFREQLRRIPAGVTVCVLALVGAQLGSAGDTLLLTRLEKDAGPTPLSSVLSDFDAIQKEQKECSACTDKQDWWLRRSELDRRMKHLQKLPWESMACLRAVPVTRLPSLRFLLSYSLARERGGSVLSRGIDPSSTFYVLNPHKNLPGTEEQFRSWFESPLVLGNLWDVTDRDIDRYVRALLEGWLGGGAGAPLLSHVTQARQAPRLKYLIGAAPVAYGLPVCLR
ncbi:Espl1, partial [Columba guinea]